jgi:adenylate kinase
MTFFIAESDIGNAAKEFMDRGELVPDNVIIDLVVDRLAQDDCKANGFLLDGFPRTAAQAEALKEAGVEIDAFILMDVPAEVLVERVEGRRLDPETGKIYHMTFSPPENDEIADRLTQRAGM